MVAPSTNGSRHEDNLARQKAITAELNQLSLREVMESLLGFQGKKGGVHMLKYEVAPGFYLNCSIDEPWFASFNGVPIPGLNGRNPNASFGAINLVIAVRSILGDPCDFKRARAELQRAFLPSSLNDEYVPSGMPSRGPSQGAASPEEKEVPKELPARFRTAEEYLRLARSNHYRPLAKLPDDLENFVFSYLAKTRKLADPIVTDLMARNAAYPSVRERQLVSPKTGQPYFLAEPIVVFPLSSWRESFPVGYDYKTLPIDPDCPSFSASEGRKKFGAYQVGAWDKNTRQAILTEAAIDALSKWALEHPPADTCIWGMSGARTSEILLAQCKERGIAVIAAFDNDPAGRTAATATLRRCKELSIPCTCEFVRPSEIDFEIADDSDAPGRIREISILCQRDGIPFKINPTADGTHRGVVANEGAILDLLVRFRKDDTLDRITTEARGESPANNGCRVQFEVRNKDWNDVLQGEFQPALRGEAEHPLHPKRPIAAPASLEPSP